MIAPRTLIACGSADRREHYKMFKRQATRSCIQIQPPKRLRCHSPSPVLGRLLEVNTHALQQG